MADLFWFSDTRRKRITPHYPSNMRGKKQVENRRVLSGIVHVLRTGCQRSNCPAEYRPAKSVYNRFIRWAKLGISEGIISALTGAEGARDRLKIPLIDCFAISCLAVDSSVVKVQRSAGGSNVWPAREDKSLGLSRIYSAQAG